LREKTADLWPAEEGNREFSKTKAGVSLVWLKGGDPVRESKPDE